jgi:hypothetical protein
MKTDIMFRVNFQQYYLETTPDGLNINDALGVPVMSLTGKQVRDHNDKLIGKFTDVPGEFVYRRGKVLMMKTHPGTTMSDLTKELFSLRMKEMDE